MIEIQNKFNYGRDLQEKVKNLLDIHFSEKTDSFSSYYDQAKYYIQEANKLKIEFEELKQISFLSSIQSWLEKILLILEPGLYFIFLFIFRFKFIFFIKITK